MRHVISLIVSPLIAVLIYLLIGIAEVKSDTGLGQLDEDRSLGYANVGLAVGCLVVAGALYSILVLARLSPLGTVLAGAALLAVGVWAWFANESFVDRVPSGLPGISGAGHAGAGATTIALSIPLLLTLFSGRRWRRHAVPPVPPPAQAGPAGYPDQGQAGYAQPAGYAQQPGYGQAGGYQQAGYADQPGYAGQGSYAAGQGGPGGYDAGHGGYDEPPAYGQGYSAPSHYPTGATGTPSYDDTPTYSPPSYGSTLGGSESNQGSSAPDTDLFGNPRRPQS